MTPLVEHQLGDLAKPGISINYESELLIWGRACIDEIQKEKAHIPLTFLMALHYIISERFFATLFPHVKISRVSYTPASSGLLFLLSLFFCWQILQC